MKTFGENFEKDLIVDKLRLDDECEVQASLYYRWAKELAAAKEEANQADDRLKALLAQKSLLYRRNPPSDIKVTEAVFDALLNDDSDIRIAREDVTRTSHKVDTIWAMINALDNRKSMLDNLVKLQVSSYYNTESNPKSASERITKKE